jgi:hypothetical protein
MRVLALDAASSVVENTIFSAACQMAVKSRTVGDWPGTASAVSQYSIVWYIRRP